VRKANDGAKVEEPPLTQNGPWAPSWTKCQRLTGSCTSLPLRGERLRVGSVSNDLSLDLLPPMPRSAPGEAPCRMSAPFTLHLSKC